MKHLKTFRIFENEVNIEEAENQDETMTGWLYNFFNNLSAKFKEFERVYTANSYKDSFGKPIDSGLGWLIGTAGSMASNVAAKVFKPSDVFKRNGKGILGSLKSPETDADVTVDHQRLMNKDFIDNDLPNIKSENDMANWAARQYSKNGIRPNERPFFDQMVRNAAVSYKNGGKMAVGETLSGGAAAGTEVAAGTAAAETGGLLQAVTKIAPFVA
jgi:hypothetical protein